MKPRIWTSTLALAATVLGLSAAVQAQPWMGQNPAHNDMRMMHPTGAAGHWEQMAKKLGLSSKQEGQIKALHEKQQAAMKAQREQSQQLQAERSAASITPPVAPKITPAPVPPCIGLSLGISTSVSGRIWAERIIFTSSRVVSTASTSCPAYSP